jgi:tripartite ATP-independent transporter DctM subunit
MERAGGEYVMTIVLISLFFICLIIGVPLAFCLLIASIGFILTSAENIPLEVVSQRLMVGIDDFTFMAIPLFVFAGELMNVGGITFRLVRLAQGVVGHIRGGLAYVTILTNMLMAGVSGSALADAAATGSVLINAMEKAGYKKGFAAALVSASSTMGPIIPPSIPFILYALIAHVSIDRLFLAGAVPGIFLGVMLMVLVAYLARKRNFPREERMPFKDVIKAFFDALLALMMPVIVLGGILGGIFTATESAVIAVVYALFVAGVVYRELDWKEIPRMLLHTAKNTASVTLIVSCATLFGWLLTHAQIPQALAHEVTNLTKNPYIILLVLNLLMLVLSLFVEGGPLIILLAPILLPLIKSVGIDPIHFGVVMTLNAMVGLILPPVGMLLFVSGGIAKVKLQDVFKEIPPFIFILLFVLAVVTYIPQITLWLPHLIRG